MAQLNLKSMKTTDSYNISVECPHCRTLCTKGEEISYHLDWLFKKYKCVCSECKLVFLL